jgi:hypothetical protein
MNRLSRHFLGHLDQAGFGQFQVWGFGFRSLFRGYARLFFRRAVVVHPVKAARGIRRYRQFVRDNKGRDTKPMSFVFFPDEAAFLKNDSARREGPLIGLGFCLKPYDPKDSSASCPSGRPNHECQYLERGEVHPACADCDIRDLGRRSLETGCPVYIMTSAQDIARDFMLPQIDRGIFPAAVLVLCPYSVQAIILPLLICGVDMLLLTYSTGSCADYEQWLKADRGVKDERTAIDGESKERLLGLLSRLEPEGGGRIQGHGSRGFRRTGNIFYPAGANSWFADYPQK